jgi:hypothetical protein
MQASFAASATMTTTVSPLHVEVSAGRNLRMPGYAAAAQVFWLCCCLNCLQYALVCLLAAAPSHPVERKRDICGFERKGTRAI